LISTRENLFDPLAFIRIRSSISFNGGAIFQKERADQRQSWRVGNGTHFGKLEKDSRKENSYSTCGHGRVTENGFAREYGTNSR
jgi:hypothetical protein